MQIALSNCDRYVEVDDDVAEFLGERSVWVNDKGYPTLWYQGKNWRLHRLILELSGIEVPEGYHADHRNRDKLDCRRENLRVVPLSLSQYNRGLHRNNTSGYKGVSYCKDRGKWSATIHRNHKRYFLGYFDSAEEAGMAYGRGAIELWGPNAQLDIPPEPLTDDLHIRVGADFKQRLEVLAGQLGIGVSELVRLSVGEYLMCASRAGDSGARPVAA